MAAVALLERHRRALIVIICGAAIALLAALLVLTFGWSLLRHPLERHLASRLGRPVSIGAIRRVDRGFFHPELEITNLRIAQPAWTGGEMVVVRKARVKLPLFPLLVGKADPSSIDIDGLRVALIRRDATHASWKDLPPGNGLPASLRHLGIRNAALTLDDAKRDHRFNARIMADDRGLRIAGSGTLQGRPATMSLAGPAPRGEAWPFRLDYRSAIANVSLLGRADHPLDIGHFGGHAVGWTDDLRHLDLLIEAGLPATQPAHLAVDFRRDRSAWALTKLKLRVGRSDFSGHLHVAKESGRTRLDGAFLSNGLDFDDLASNEGLARAAAKRRRYGPRVIPDTAIHLEHLRQTDGVLRFDIRHLLSRQPSPFRSASVLFTLDHGVLTARPFTVSLAKGTMVGAAQVRHRSGEPLLLLDLRLKEASLSMPLGKTASGTLAGHLRLRGYGPTIRAAIAHADGRIGLVAHDGAINRRAALFLGSDAGRALLEGKTETTGLRCAIGIFTVRRGIADAGPLLIDTSVSRADGGGRIDLSNEQLGLAFTGRPKLANAARLGLPIRVTGTLFQPHIVPPAVPKTVGTLFKLIGNAIAGKHGQPAPDADCSGLTAQALR